MENRKNKGKMAIMAASNIALNSTYGATQAPTELYDPTHIGCGVGTPPSKGFISDNVMVEYVDLLDRYDKVMKNIPNVKELEKYCISETFDDTWSFKSPSNRTSSTKRGFNKKLISKRRKQNKNKKTHK